MGEMWRLLSAGAEMIMGLMDRGAGACRPLKGGRWGSGEIVHGRDNTTAFWFSGRHVWKFLRTWPGRI